MSIYGEMYKDRAFTLMSGLWFYMTELERSDERVVKHAAQDLLDLKARIDRLLAKATSEAA